MAIIAGVCASKDVQRHKVAVAGASEKGEEAVLAWDNGASNGYLSKRDVTAIIKPNRGHLKGSKAFIVTTIGIGNSLLQMAVANEAPTYFLILNKAT